MVSYFAAFSHEKKFLGSISHDNMLKVCNLSVSRKEKRNYLKKQGGACN